jgi:hypothetical protein
MNIQDNFSLKHNWILWFHKVNDNNWDLNSYSKIYEIKTYYDILFILKEINNITSGMFFLMKEGINPVYEDDKNINGAYWSLRVTKKDSFEIWEKLLYYLTLDSITENVEYEQYINGFSVSPKINNCIFKIWNSSFDNIKTDHLKKDLNFIKYDELFYLQHKND